VTDQAQNLRELMRTQTPAEGKPRFIAVSSGKGGVGKTNVAINLALAYHEIGKRVIVMDADLGLANVNIVLGVIPKYNLYHLIRKQKQMKDILLETRYGIRIVAGASGFSQVANLSTEERNHFITELQDLSNADVIIIDTSAGISHNVLAFIAAADDVVIVTTPEPTAITDAYGVIKVIATEMASMDLALKLVVNRVKSVTQAKQVSQRVINIAGQFLNMKVDYLGFVYEDPLVQSSVLRQQPFFFSSPRGKASICMRHLVGRLENVEYKEGGGVGRFITRLFGPGG